MSVNPDLQELWRESWSGEGWTAPWAKAIDPLTPEQAAWKPEGARHSIWQLVNHVSFWREVTLRRVAGEPPLAADPPHEEQFAAPARVDAEEWARARARLHDLHGRIQALLDDAAVTNERVRHHLPHDAYHLGQIMQLRGMQGLGVVV